MNKIVREFKEAITTDTSTKAYDTQATVVRAEDSTLWVHMPGGVDETPVKKTIGAKVGDTVQVRVSGGSAWLVGNQSAPPTDDTRANVAYATANIAVDNANVAAQAADSAVESAGRAMAAAESAQTSANEAKRSADEANTQATYATNYANNALTQLSTVESVVDALTWISEHSVFIPTEDTTVQTSKLYYLPDDNMLTLTSGTTTINGLTFVTDAEAGTVIVNGTATAYTELILWETDVATSTKLWLSGVSGGTSNTYRLQYNNAGSSKLIYDGVLEVSAVSGAPFKIIIISGYTAENLVFTPKIATGTDGFEYKIVQNPTGNPSAQGWYELSTEEAVKTYVQTHLALTNDGLYVLNDSSAYKLLLANDGMYIQAPNGTTVNQSTADGNIIRATNGTVIAHLGYGEGTASSGTASAPYYDLGVRKNNSTKGNYSLTEGIGTTASGYVSHAEGEDTIASGRGSHAEGGYLEINGVQYTTTASGQYSHAEGAGTTASSERSHAEGQQTTASGNSAHAEGNGTTASGGYGAHAEGYITTASGGEAAHAEGTHTTASGNYGSHAEGDSTTASGDSSHSQNRGTIAQGLYQTAIGRYNVAQGSQSSATISDHAFIIGNGTPSARSNALTVDWSGNVNIASGAKYKINGTNLSASDVGALPNPSAGSVSEMGQYIDLHASGGATDYDVRLATNQATSTGGGFLHINGQPMKDFVVAHETKTTTGLATSWTVRKWNSGYCEAYTKTNSTGYPMTNAYTNGYYYAVSQALPSSLFTSVDYGQVDRCGGTSTSGLITASLYNLSTTQVQWYAFDTRSETVNCSFSIRIVGKWK